VSVGYSKELENTYHIFFARGEYIMLHTLKDLESFAIHATDGDLGLVNDFYFDDKQWVVRYLVVETGSWSESKKVLLSPISIKHLNREDKTLTVFISMDQVKHSPTIDTEKPVSLQFEVDYLGYYGYPFYWGGTSLWGGYPIPQMIAPGFSIETSDDEHGIDLQDIFADVDAMRYRDQDHHLRSSNVVIGYHIEAADGEIGHLQGMLIDTETFAIRYLIINTSNWWLGHLVLVSPQWINDVSWVNSKICVDLTQQQVKGAPHFDPAITFNRENDEAIHRHYGRTGYWR
jgi:hypothetical protein